MRAKRKGFGGGEEGEVKADLERGKKKQGIDAGCQCNNSYLYTAYISIPGDARGIYKVLHWL